MRVTYYVDGFLFDEKFERVVLIEKNKDWQAGKLNGVGGKVELIESTHPIRAMIREFAEETGLHIEDWKKFCTLYGMDKDSNIWNVNFFYAVGPVDTIRQMESEVPSVVSVKTIASLNVVENLNWLIPMALHHHKTGESYMIQEKQPPVM